MDKIFKEIKQYVLSDNSNTGILVQELNSNSRTAHATEIPHRDDHYQLLFAFDGQYHFKIDFEDVNVRAPFVLWVEPAQVHQVIKMIDPKGWIIGIDNSFLEDEFKKFLDGTDKIILITDKQKSFQQSIEIILERAFHFQKQDHSVFIKRAIFHLINTVLCLLIRETSSTNTVDGIASKERRAYIIEQEFKALLKSHYKDWKSPSQYAKQLSLTTAHLNDSMKEVTGKSVTAHLQEYCMMEAKRLLYFTDLEVREIAFSIGFEDAVYFGKLFRKLTGFTPLGFRNKFRD